MCTKTSSRNTTNRKLFFYTTRKKINTTACKRAYSFDTKNNAPQCYTRNKLLETTICTKDLLLTQQCVHNDVNKGSPVDTTFPYALL